MSDAQLLRVDLGARGHGRGGAGAGDGQAGGGVGQAHRLQRAAALDQRRGVCQDFAHLAIGCLRSLGLPARYVSGYLETVPPPGRERLQGADMSHSWFSAFIPGTGWLDLDPTNDLLVGNRHVVTAWGRDYADVPPLKGVLFSDAGRHELSVSVDVVPEAV